MDVTNAGDQGFALATTSMTPGSFQREKKGNRTRRTSLLFNSLPTNCIYPAN